MFQLSNQEVTSLRSQFVTSSQGEKYGNDCPNSSRNMRRFPSDFMLQLSSEESDFLRSQIATLKAVRGKHRKYLPYAFTEQGVSGKENWIPGRRKDGTVQDIKPQKSKVVTICDHPL